MHVNWALMLCQKAFILTLGTSITDTTNYDSVLKKKGKAVDEQEKKTN